MFGSRKRLAAVIAAAALALSACSSTEAGTKGGSVGAQNGAVTGTRKATGAQSASPGVDSKAAKTVQTRSAPAGVDSKAAWADIKLGAIRIDAKLGTPWAEITITNHSSKRSNYIVDLSIMSAGGKTRLDAAMVSAPGLASGQTTTRTAHFMTTQKLPAGATLTLVGVARLVP